MVGYSVLLGLYLGAVGLHARREPSGDDLRPPGDPMTRWFSSVAAVTWLLSFSIPCWTVSIDAISASAAGAVGAVILALALLLRWRAYVALGPLFTYDLAVRRGHRLVDRGPYAYVRHPGYTASLLAGVGLGVAARSPALLVTQLALLGPMFAVRVRAEEAALEQALGATWRRYCERTPAMFPRLFRGWPGASARSR